MSTGRLVLLSSGVTASAVAVAHGLSPDRFPVWPLALALAGFAAVILIGVMSPRLAMFAPVLCRTSSGRPEVALTFDDGPSPASTPKVLAELARHGARATFFVLGAKARRHPDLLQAIHAAGHEIGLHGDQHDRLLSIRHPRRIMAELTRAQAIIESLTGQRPRLFRPPVGHISPRTALAAGRLGLTLVGWSVRAYDGVRTAIAAHVASRVAKRLEPGAIVLLHDASEREQYEPAGVAALPAILAEAARRGLACVTLSESLSKRA